GIDLTLADQSPGMVSEAIGAVTASGGTWNSISSKVADVCALPFEDDSFDVVTAMHMLYHASDKDRAVAEIARVLRRSGKLIVTTNGAETMKELNALSHDIFGTPPYDFGSAPFSLESGEPILRKYFRTVDIRSNTDILRVTEADDVVNFLTSFPPGEDADAAALDRLRRELARRMPDGVFPITRIAGSMVASGHIATERRP
ncbi:MAG TPA: class I SAM-dependent methyltransferase, partial [Rhizomicrobium sp.]|nr:class I SAM-dependent methyltransferase [Rhizomicrobium sp.]